MEQLSQDFPKGLEYRVIYDPTVFVEESVNAVFHTIFEAVLLVVLVVMIFLQSWRATLIPLVAIPVSLIGTFAAMSAFGFSLNNLSLFGLVLAIGIVVDDAIVVVENIERNIEEGLSPCDAARKAMDEVGGPVVSVALVLARGLCPDRFHQRNQRAVLPAVRPNDRGLDGHFRLRLAHPQPGARRHSAPAARREERLVRPLHRHRFSAGSSAALTNSSGRPSAFMCRRLAGSSGAAGSP